MAEQPTQKEFKAVDIVDYAMQGNPLRINDAFGHLISNKVVDSLATRKQEVSAKIFTDKVEEPTSEPEAETTEEQ
jgi:hypothetical protein